MGKAARFTDKKEIRYAICELLSNKVDVGGRVYANRVRPVGVEELPIILIYPQTIDFTRLRIDPSYTLRRDLIITVEIIAQETTEDSLSDQLDELFEQVHDAIDDSDKLGGLVHDINIDTATTGYTGQGDKPEGSWTMNFNVSYIKKPKE
jgi:hypothetical protein